MLYSESAWTDDVIGKDLYVLYRCLAESYYFLIRGLRNERNTT